MGCARRAVEVAIRVEGSCEMKDEKEVSDGNEETREGADGP